MTLPMARDLARFGIRVNTIAPALFVSPMMMQMPEKVRQALSRDLVFPNRFGHPEEFAHMVRYLIEATYVNGENYRLSGAGRMGPRL
jgi:NAD(P)-dependent dehydrogenase (short-subunit alcohol dehydrogenase family)